MKQCLQIILPEKNDIWNIRRLVDESFVQSNQRPSVLYWRLSDFRCATWNSNLELTLLSRLVVPKKNAEKFGSKIFKWTRSANNDNLTQIQMVFSRNVLFIEVCNNYFWESWLMQIISYLGKQKIIMLSSGKVEWFVIQIVALLKELTTNNQ